MADEFFEIAKKVIETGKASEDDNELSSQTLTSVNESLEKSTRFVLNMIIDKKDD